MITVDEEMRKIASQLYGALIQMKKRRGVYIDDIDEVFNALEAYEDMIMKEI